MKTDKTAFLLLTGVLSSISVCAVLAGCTIQAADDSPETAQESVESADTDGATTTAAEGVEAGAGTGTGSGSGTKPTTPAPTNKDAGGTTTAEGGATKDSGPAAACLDDSAPAAQPACATVGAGTPCANACTNFALSWKKGLSADVRKCMTAAICQAGTATCADKALAKACPDPTAATFCTPNVTGCKAANGADTLTQASCEGLAKGLSTAGRANLKTCFEQEFNCGDCIGKFK